VEQARVHWNGIAIEARLRRRPEKSGGAAPLNDREANGEASRALCTGQMENDAHYSIMRLRSLGFFLVALPH